MPFLSVDPFRECLYESTQCPEDVAVPLKDYDAYQIHPEHRWVYNKLTIAEKQGLLCAPHGVKPPTFPVFSKPIYNLRSMGHGSRILNDVQDYINHCAPGHMWSELLTGDHISTDLAVLDGRVVWWSHTRGYPMEGGTFDRWEVNVAIPDAHHAYLRQFVETNLPTYTGMMNIETIGGKIIEAHLRFTEQWPDTYPAGFLPSVINLYKHHVWMPPEELLRNEVKGHSVVLFGGPDRTYWVKPQEEMWEQIRKRYASISSITVTFLENGLARNYSMPPGGFRLACVNGRDLGDCLKARHELEILLRSLNSSMTRVSQI